MKKLNTERSVQNAIAQSEKVIGIFSETINGLKRANDELDAASEADIQEVARLEQNIQTSQEQKAQNSSIIEKINHIILGGNGEHAG